MNQPKLPLTSGRDRQAQLALFDPAGDKKKRKRQRIADMLGLMRAQIGKMEVSK